MEKKIQWIVFCSLLSILFNSEAFGCIYNIRDIGFVDFSPTPYNLYCYIRNDTPEDLISSFKSISYATFMDSNIEFEIINIDQQKAHPALEYFHFWEIKSCPAAILVSPAVWSLVLPLTDTNKPFKEAVWSSLEHVVSSKKREEILQHIVKAYCVVLIIEGKDAVENKRVYEAVAGVTKKITKIMNQSPKYIDEPPYVVVIPQEEIPQEKILLWSLGVNERDVSDSHVVTLYGRGRQLGSLLIGRQITERNVYDILSVLSLSCDCGLDRNWMIGPFIPLRWDGKIQSEVVKSLGFDAESPLVKREMSMILSLGPSSISKNNEAMVGTGSPFEGYGEEVIRPEGGAPAKRVSPAQFREFVSPKSAGTSKGSPMRMVLVVVGLIFVVILAGGLFILLKARRRIS